MTSNVLRRLLAAAAILLGSCGGNRDGNQPSAQRLEPPQAVFVDSSLCLAALPTTPSLLAYGMVRGLCARLFTGIDAAATVATRRERALATAPTRIVSINDLFDWAERSYPQFFPSHRANAVLGPYTYRYYPETQNHVAVAADLIYIQGPISGNLLQLVGSLADYTCLVDPAACGVAPKPCPAATSWVVNGNTCTPNEGQPSQIASGATYTFSDSLGASYGNASYSCNDGKLTTTGTPTCDLLPPKNCSASAVSWTVGAQQCTPNASDPTTLVSGTSFTFTDSVGTFGSASFSCNDGSLTQSGTSVCNAAPALECRPANIAWSVGANSCFTDPLPDRVAEGANILFINTKPGFIGNDSYICRNGTLQRTGAPSCDALPPHIQDSFGGDGGAADGGASGDGSAADGLPIVGARVSVTDTTGRVVFAENLTDVRGYYRVKLSGMVPPLVISVTRTNGLVRRSLSTQALKINGYIFMAVTGITDKIASDVARAAGFSSAAALTPAMVAANPSAVTAAINAVRNDEFINPQLVAAGINASTFDPLATPFRPDGTGYDRVLDNIVVSTDSSGATIIGPTYCVTPTSWTVGNLTCVPDAGQASIIQSYSTVIVKDTVGSPRGTVGFSCVRGVLQKPVLPNCTA